MSGSKSAAVNIVEDTESSSLVLIKSLAIIVVSFIAVTVMIRVSFTHLGNGDPASQTLYTAISLPLKFV